MQSYSFKKKDFQKAFNKGNKFAFIIYEFANEYFYFSNL